MIAFNITITDREKENYIGALSDFLCWIEGFKAAGGKYLPETEAAFIRLKSSISDAKEISE